MFTLVDSPPAREGSREVANLTEQKNSHTPINGVKEFVCLSVCYLIRGILYLLGWVHVEDALSIKYEVKPFNLRFETFHSLHSLIFTPSG